MHKQLPAKVIFVLFFISCTSASHLDTKRNTGTRNYIANAQPVTSSFEDVDTSFIIPDDITVAKIPASLTDLPRTEARAFVLAPGYYEGDFKTYCLQPGTPAPAANDAYFQTSLQGARKDVIQTILRNSQFESRLDQRNIQLLLWSVVSRSDFSKLSPAVKNTAYQLLSPKQLFQLNGGVVGAVKVVSGMLPGSGGVGTIKTLFESGVSSYEAFERLAVPGGSSEIYRSDFRRGQWYKHADGYYVRYFPNGYQQTKIQVYVPEALITTETEKRLVFDPVSLVVVPANSNAQRLGIGGPVQDIVRAVIRTIKTGTKTKRSEKNKDIKNTEPETNTKTKT